jgi:ADP-dependent NAD(P)H-hydrate dehydratase / NAD(P)H-hydrate epimerase
VLVYSGGELQTGASRLAALAAARSGAGAVTLCGTKEALNIHAAHLSSIMLRTRMEIDFARYSACCIGPAFGIGPETCLRVMEVMEKDIPTVIDADGLTSFEHDPHCLFTAIKAASAAAVLTPHEGEFSRLFKSISGTDDPKHEKARAAAALSGAIIVYKGPDTVIAHPDGRAVINTNATPKLATAGSGDVLAGLISGLLAQGMDAFEAARAAVWLHAEAATRITRRTIIAEDLIEAL